MIARGMTSKDPVYTWADIGKTARWVNPYAAAVEKAWKRYDQEVERKIAADAHDLPLVDEYPETYYPLKLYVCAMCWLVQTEDYARANELFRHDYAYFSSISQTWLGHAARYSRMIQKRLNLGNSSFVVEVASNDGYLLRNFVAADIPCLGIEPTASTAAAAEAIGIPVLREFFGTSLGNKLANEDDKLISLSATMSMRTYLTSMTSPQGLMLP